MESIMFKGPSVEMAMAETKDGKVNGNCANRVLACRYCILGFEYNEIVKHAEFYHSVSNDILQTTDEWDKVKFYQTLEEAESMRLRLREDYNDYGWYVVICNAR